MPASPGGACDGSEAAACPGLRSPEAFAAAPTHNARLAEGRTEPDFEPNDRAVVVVVVLAGLDFNVLRQQLSAGPPECAGQTPPAEPPGQARRLPACQ